MMYVKGGRGFKMTKKEEQVQRDREESDTYIRRERAQEQERRRIRSIVTAENQNQYHTFLELVKQEVEQRHLDPNMGYQFIEAMCMRVVSKILSGGAIPRELDLLREFMIQELAIRRNNKNKEALILIYHISTDNIDELILSIQRVTFLCSRVLQSDVVPVVPLTPVSTTAFALLDECCDQLITIVNNDNRHITPQQKEKAKILISEIFRVVGNMSWNYIPLCTSPNLSQPILQLETRMRNKIIQQPWWHEYEQHARQQQQQQQQPLWEIRRGGRKISKSFKKQLKNTLIRHASKRTNKKNKNKNRKKTLRLRIKK